LDEDLVESAGRPIFILPYAGTFPALGKRPLISILVLTGSN